MRGSQPNFVHYPLFRSEILPPFLYPISAFQFIREVYVLVLVLLALEERGSQSQPADLPPLLLLSSVGQKRSQRENWGRDRRQ